MTDTPSLTHVSPDGHIQMVNVGNKQTTTRTARAEARVRISPELAQQLATHGSVTKGNVLETARLAGIMAAKRTAELIPLCHQIPLDVVEITAELENESVHITARVVCHHTTGVEMEALTAASVAALTVYDMCKAADKGIVIENIRLLEKTGGKSGNWHAR
jgi:cyclic pyranopterin monophosphate synthase